MTKKRGIVDPWRSLEPLRPPAKEPPREGKIDLHEIDYDADLAIPGRYVIRTTHASFDVTSLRVTSPGDALEVLVDCVLDVALTKRPGLAMIEAGVGARRGNRAFNAPVDEARASVLRNERACIWLAEKTLDDGMLALARILRAPDAAATTKKHGVVPMLSA